MSAAPKSNTSSPKPSESGKAKNSAESTHLKTANSRTQSPKSRTSNKTPNSRGTSPKSRLSKKEDSKVEDEDNEELNAEEQVEHTTPELPEELKVTEEPLVIKKTHSLLFNYLKFIKLK
jgi:hypothetical protein